MTSTGHGRIGLTPHANNKTLLSSFIERDTYCSLVDQMHGQIIADALRPQVPVVR